MASDAQTSGKNCVITKQLLKLRSCEFDVESIHTLSLKELNILDLGCISECINLTNLDLSHNKLSRLNKLSGLKLLQKLNVSANMIVSLDGLQTLENVESLNVSGNLLGSIDLLHSISSLGNLKNLTLNDKAAGLSNPMCNVSYVDHVLVILPNLTQLDAQRIKGRGSELFELSKGMDVVLLGLASIFSTTNLPTSKNINLKVEHGQDPFNRVENKRVMAAEKQLSDLLYDCTSLSKQAVQILTKTKATQNSSIKQ